MFTRRGLAKLIVPLMLQQVFQLTIGMMDSLMLASDGVAAVSGVSLVSTLDILLIYIFTALSSGGSILIAQGIGRGDQVGTRNIAKQMLYACTGVAAALSVVVLACRGVLLGALFGSADADVMMHAQEYFFYIALSFPFLAVYEAGAATCRVMGKTFSYMLVNIWMNLINIALNALFIYGFSMGAAGAGLATMISRAVGAAIMLGMLHNKRNPVYVERLLQYRPDLTVIRAILRIGVPNGIESGMFQLGKLMTHSLVSMLGTAAIAANAVAHTVSNYQYMPGTAIGLAMITVVGQCVGAEKKHEAKQYVKKLMAVAYVCLAIVSLLTLLLIKPIVVAYGLTGETAGMTYRLVMLHTISAAAIWPIAFVLPYAFRAAGDVKFTLIVSACSMWVFRVALGYILALEKLSLFGLTVTGVGMGVFGVWLAMVVDWIFRSIMNLIRYLSGIWLTKYRGSSRNE